MNWYTTESAKKKVKQVVVEIPKGHEEESQFGMIMLANKYMHLIMNTWAMGFFKLDSAPGPFLMVRGDNVASKLRSCPIKIAYSFYRMKSGGLVTFYVYVDCPKVAKNLTYPIVLFERIFGCDDRETKNTTREVLNLDSLRVCFAEGDGPGEDHGGILSHSSIDAEFDIVVSIPSQYKAVLKQELESIYKYHNSIPKHRRDFNASTQEMWDENPQTELPILPAPEPNRSKATPVTAESSTASKQPSISTAPLKKWWQFWR